MIEHCVIPRIRKWVPTLF